MGIGGQNATVVNRKKKEEEERVAKQEQETEKKVVDLSKLTEEQLEKRRREHLAAGPVVTPRPEVLRGPAGAPSGIEVNGRTFLGLTPEDVIDVQEQEQLLPGAPGIAPRGVTQEAFAQQVGAAEGLLRERGVLGARAPLRAETDLDLVGAGEEALSPTIGVLKELVRTAELFKGEPELTAPLIDDPQTILEISKRQAQLEVIQQGTTAAEKIGALVEAIPIIGSLAQKHASGMIQDPRSNVDTIVADIGQIRETASTMSEKAAAGKLGDPVEVLNVLDDMDTQVARLEQRIKLLSTQSAQLRADADALNKIETQIFRAKLRLFEAKQSVAVGAVKEPTPEQIMLDLMENRNI